MDEAARNRPEDDASITFDDLFELEDLQRLQNEFAEATGVASIITRPDGTPITAPSNFCRLCSEIIRKTAKGLANCYRSDAVIGQPCGTGPTIQPCMSGGLWDAGAGISVGGRHIANWLIGQVRDETQTEEKMAAYAREIEADEVAAVEAFREVRAMSREKFEKVAKVLHTLAHQLSNTAFQNVQMARSIAERSRAEDALRESEEKFRNVFRNAPVGLILTDSQGAVLDCNLHFSKIFGARREDYLGMNLLARIPEGPVRQNLVGATCDNKIHHYEGPYVSVVTGKKLDLTISSERVAPDLIISLIVDVTERKRAEAENASLEIQLRQAQKMESVGRLAGGVAHDFNNMLSVILGHAEMALARVDPAEPLYVDLQDIQKAGERSADLVRQLLAFARKQTVAPKVLDLNATVEGMLKMLQRLIGEHIVLTWRPEPELWPVYMDPSQLDQILANLCVNARDAIADVGKITIETENVAFDEEYCSHCPGFRPGEHVRLTVSDNGCGMGEATLAHVFEPFFTTKRVGEGTGLGLATVYGAVQQNGGFINAYSEPGEGTAFAIHLPRHLGKREQAGSKGVAMPVPPGQETVLLVEDEPSILSVVEKMLVGQGYTVLAAGTPGEAIELAREHAGQIHLLVTDVVMPEMNGRDLAKSLLSLYPHMKRLFMSGYTADVIAHHGVLDEGVHFLQKPFQMRELAAKLREVLGSGGRGESV